METDIDEIDEELAEEPAKETDKDARNWAIVCHLSAFCMFIGIPFGNILGPLVIWLIKRNEYAFVNDQGKAAMNFQISMTFYAVIIFAIGFGIIFSQSGAFGGAFFLMFAIILIIYIADVVLIVIAAINSNKGIFYRYPFTIEFIK